MKSPLTHRSWGPFHGSWGPFLWSLCNPGSSNTDKPGSKASPEGSGHYPELIWEHAGLYSLDSQSAGAWHSCRIPPEAHTLITALHPPGNDRLPADTQTQRPLSCLLPPVVVEHRQCDLCDLGSSATGHYWRLSWWVTLLIAM